jgi:hypothetical protein
MFLLNELKNEWKMDESVIIPKENRTLPAPLF